jgi:1-acyl-sn-glycerol-3-phosphate acyltransferase
VDVHEVKPAINSLFCVSYTLLMSGRAWRRCSATYDNGAYGEVGLAWARHLCERCGVRVHSSGSELVDWRRPLVVVANHQSFFDIPVLLLASNCGLRFLAKRELFKVPLFGAALRRAGMVAIDRANRTAAHRSVEEAARRVRQGASVAVFPEGTRSHGGELRPFKKGAFHLAQRAGVPVLPVGIAGTRDVLAKDSLLVHGASVAVHFGQPIACSDDSEEARERLRAEAWAAVASLKEAAERAQAT